MSSPIRVWFIGLSVSGGWAATAHLPYLKISSKYVVTAVCNSSTQTSDAAIRQYGLGSASAFDSVTSMCASAEVDLVVCAVAVFSHYKLIKPAIEAGKDVYVEWPLAASTEEAHELVELAQKKGVKTIIGMQGLVSPTQIALQDLLQSGRIGRPLATQIMGSSCTPETGTLLDKRYSYFKDAESPGAAGQVMLSIYIGHTFEPVAQLLGEPVTVSSQLKTTWPRVKILDGDKVLESDVEKTADDYASLQGTTQSGIPYTYCLRGGDSFEEGQGFVWDIIGDKGQIRVTGSTIMMNLGAEDYSVRVKDYKTGTVESVPLQKPLDLPLAAQNIGQLYERFADGGSYPNFENAIRRHHFLDAVFASGKNSGQRQEVPI